MAKKKKKNTWKGLLIVIVAIILVNVAQIIANDNNTTTGANIEGLEKVVIPEGMTNETVTYTGFSVYFNRDTHLPNCTVYELTATEAKGDLPRDNNFHQDENVEGCPTLDDYKYSGYDRGHMVPAGDMKWDKDAMYDCFCLTNMVPQKQALNSGAWNKLEQKVRNWAERDSALIVITGPIVAKEDLANTIGENEVVVPGKIFKVVLAPHASPMRAIAFIYPNMKAKHGLAEHAASVDEVEAATGMDFFSSLPDDLETKVEAEYDLNLWNIR